MDGSASGARLYRRDPIMRTRQYVPSHRVRKAVVAILLQAAAACRDDAGTAPNDGKPRKAMLTIVSGNRQTGEVGDVLSQPLVVALHDSLDAPLARVVVRFYDEANVAQDSAITDERGVAGVRWKLGPRASEQHIVAAAAIYAGSAYTIADATFTATALRGPAARLEVTTRRDFASPGSLLDTVTAIVVDRFENRVAGAPIEWLVELGGGSVRALSAITDAQGVARAAWTLGTRPGDNVLVATSASLAGRLTAFGSIGFPAVSIVVGAQHTCGLTQSGAAYCWGASAWGQLGPGSGDATTPIRVAGAPAFTQLVAGTFHTCGLTSAGAAYCWGGNFVGQVGPGEYVVATPRPIGAPSPFTALAAGSGHTCGLTTERIVYCWGSNTVGELGDGLDRSTPVGSLSRSTPAPIAGGMSFTAIAASFLATCAIATTSQAYCWGANGGGELGTGTGNCRMLADWYYNREDWDWPCSTRPVPIDAREPMTSLTASGYGICGLTTARALVCWGGGTHLPPTTIPGSNVSAAWSVGHIVCGLEPTEALSCWGLWAATPRTPPPFGDALTLVNLSSSGATSCGVSRSQPPIAYCWGQNDRGQLGDGTREYRNNPVAVALPRGR